MHNKKKVALIFGTRPEAIKMAPVWSAFRERSDEFAARVIVTAQHRAMLDQVLELFQIRPDFDLDAMTPGQTLAELAARILPRLDHILGQEKPDLVLVHGDTSTTFLAALAAFYHRIPVGHVEAGLRTYHRYSPFPEEVNRRLTAVLTDWHFVPTPEAHRNLIRENIPPSDVFVTGNTVIDALLITAASTQSFLPPAISGILPEQRVLLVTAHRRENWGPPMEQICRALLRLTRSFPDVAVVLPMHPNPKVRAVVRRHLSDVSRIHLCEPQEYASFVQLMKRSHLIMTDSGGIQEEAPALGKPVLVLRDTTERPEALKAGTAVLAGTGEEGVYSAAARILQDPAVHAQMAKADNPYGDGKAAGRIVEYIRWRMGFRPECPEAFVPRIQ